MSKTHIGMTGEAFLDAIEAAATALDRDAMSRCETIAFVRKDLRWQAAVRHADNYVVATLRGNAMLAEMCGDAFRRLVPAIRTA